MIKPIFIDLTTEQCEELFPESKGHWKPYTLPLYSMQEISRQVVDLTSIEIEKFIFDVPRAIVQ